MDTIVLDTLRTTKCGPSLSLSEMLGRFYCQNITELYIKIADVYTENIIANTNDEINTYISDLFTELAEQATTEDELIFMHQTIANVCKSIKEYLKPFNKGEKTKDSEYHLLTRVRKDLENKKEYIDYIMSERLEVENYKVIWFIVTELKNPDYLFKLFKENDEIVNIKDIQGNSLFVNICDNYLANIGNLNKEDIKYYKRLFCLFLEDLNLKLTNEELDHILETTEANKINSNGSTRGDISFLINEINRHYELINSGYRKSCVDYCNQIPPIVIADHTLDGRKDLRDEFTISIDIIRQAEVGKMLIDDAFSIHKYGEYYYVDVHVADPDFYVPRDSEADDFMRNLGESVYAHDYKTPMINYDVAYDKCSLNKNTERPAITYRLKIDSTGNIVDVDFVKSIVKVNYNLTHVAANYMFDKNNTDKKFYHLHDMFDIAKEMRRNRKETIGKRSKASIIVDEFNIGADLAVAGYFEKNGIIFPYKNFLGNKDKRVQNDISSSEEFLSENLIQEEGRVILHDIFDCENRVFYDTINHGNSAVGGRPIGNVGNPLREYISLETLRLIKDLLIFKKGNYDYWQERVERDCIECTETTSQIKELYKTKKLTH